MAGTESTVLLLGDTGTGKELLAHGIHAASRRAARSFVGVNIAAVPDTLLEAEFFGVAPGAYTGADRKGRDGKFKLADGGTLFLDEIGDMPLALQAKLLRVLQEQELEPLGSNQVQKVDVRVIAATSRDLAAMVAGGSFRADLYYRLNVLPIRLPALRERLSDIEALAEALLEDIARRSGLAAKGLSADALDRLATRDWPGNIRELRNVLEQSALMTDDRVLTAAHLDGAGASIPAAGLPEAADPSGGPARPAAAPARPAMATLPGTVALPWPTAAPVTAPTAAPTADPTADPTAAPTTAPTADTTADLTADPSRTASAALRPLPEQVAELERRAMAAALQATGGNRMAAARLLKISRAAFYDKLARYPELVAKAPVNASAD